MCRNGQREYQVLLRGDYGRVAPNYAKRVAGVHLELLYRGSQGRRQIVLTGGRGMFIGGQCRLAYVLGVIEGTIVLDLSGSVFRYTKLSSFEGRTMRLSFFLSVTRRCDRATAILRYDRLFRRNVVRYLSRIIPLYGAERVRLYQVMTVLLLCVQYFMRSVEVFSCVPM